MGSLEKNGGRRERDFGNGERFESNRSIDNDAVFDLQSADLEHDDNRSENETASLGLPPSSYSQATIRHGWHFAEWLETKIDSAVEALTEQAGCCGVQLHFHISRNLALMMVQDNCT